MQGESKVLEVEDGRTSLAFKGSRLLPLSLRFCWPQGLRTNIEQQQESQTGEERGGGVGGLGMEGERPLKNEEK